jgi:predicted RNA-binding protein (virulence factor B family)
MIKLGKTQKLTAIRKTPIGLYLNSKEDRDTEDILLPKAELSMSKAAFKRAVGRLLKEGAIKITEGGLERMW